MTATDTTTPRKPRRFNTMRAKGWLLCLLGLVLLGSPLVAGTSPAMAAYAGALRPAGWFAFAAGAILLALHHRAVARGAKGQTPAAAPVTPAEATATATLTPSTGHPTLRELRDEIKKAK